MSDEAWTIQVGESTAETAASVRTKYLSNTGTEELTTTLKSLYDTAANWISTNGQNVLDRLGILERGPIIVNTSRLLTANDNKRKLLVTATVTLTWPLGGIAGFEANVDIDATGQLTLADEEPIPGDDLDAPNGKIAEAGTMVHIYERPDNGKLRLNGTFIV